MTFENFRSLVQLQSLALTIPLLVLCVLVIRELQKPVHSACLGWGGKRKKQMCWILIGLLFGFSGKIVESIWWFIPWTLSYLEHPSWKSFNDMGVFVNIIFRQLFFTFSAYCHLRAFIAPDKQSSATKATNYILLTAFIIGQIYMVILYRANPF